jgi:cytochrome b6-f complex subunit 4
MAVIKKPDLTDPVLRAKLAKGMGHNYYGELLGQMIYYTCSQLQFWSFACVIGLAVLDQLQLVKLQIHLQLH